MVLMRVVVAVVVVVGSTGQMVVEMGIVSVVTVGVPGQSGTSGAHEVMVRMLVV